MELQQLRYFKALAENGNLTRTAERLHITPPTLSNSITRLESELGAQLFDRVKGRLYLNAMGKVFLESSRTVLNVLESSCNNVRNMSILGKKILSISNAVSSYLLSEVIAKFLLQHPDVRLVNKQSNVINIGTDISENHFTFAITLEGSIDDRFLNSRVLSSENKIFSVGMAKKHPLAKMKSLKLSDLKNENFIFPPSDLALTKSFYAICRNAGFEPNVIAECNSFLLTQFVEDGLGITFVASAGFLNDRTMVKVPVSDVRNFVQDRFTIYWSKNHQLSDTESAFLEFITDYFNNY